MTKLISEGRWLHIADLLRLRHPKVIECNPRLDVMLQKRLILQHIQDTHKDGDMGKVIRLVNDLSSHPGYHSSDDEQLSWNVYEKDTLKTEPAEKYLEETIDALRIHDDPIGPLEIVLMDIILVFTHLWKAGEVFPPIMGKVLTHLIYDHYPRMDWHEVVRVIATANRI